jgi:hypothetical protein
VLAIGPPCRRHHSEEELCDETITTSRSRRARAAQAATRTPARGGPRGKADAGMLQALRERVAFLRGFVAHPDQVGSVIPSSHVLEQRLVRSARLLRRAAWSNSGRAPAAPRAPFCARCRPARTCWPSN